MKQIDHKHGFVNTDFTIPKRVEPAQIKVKRQEYPSMEERIELEAKLLDINETKR